VNRAQVCFVCSPSLGILDNWLPVLCELRRRADNVDIVCVIPRAHTVDEVDPTNVLCTLADGVVSRVIFRSYSDAWISAPTLSDSKRMNVMGFRERLARRISRNLPNRGAARSAGHLIAKALRLGSPRAAGTVTLESALAGTRAVLYDVYEERKGYNRELMTTLGGVPRFSICHGIDVKTVAGESLPPTQPLARGEIIAYLFSDLERNYYLQRFGVADSAVKVVGVPRHAAAWIQTVIGRSRPASAELGDGFIFVISRPGTTAYFPRERKRAAIEDIRRLAFDSLGLKVVVKLHPKEHPEGLYEEVFGEESYGVRWTYSNLHPFVLGERCQFAITFFSGVATDMLALNTPVIERLDLRGIPEYDNPDSLRSETGEPVFSYRRLGLVLGASDYAELERHAEAVIRNRRDVVNALGATYRSTFPVVEDVSGGIVQDVLSRIGRGKAADAHS
jgi:hypothetical protein